VIAILGALVLRAVMIRIGAWLIAQFHWIMYLFGAFLVFTGVKMWLATRQEPDLGTNPALKIPGKGAGCMSVRRRGSPTVSGRDRFRQTGGGAAA
jgi:predicted tellurium resistance membrane protein TerC